jgi:cytochrome c biogenesis protein CcmG/thiol:disulfide interchange protein DsbE
MKFAISWIGLVVLTAGAAVLASEPVAPAPDLTLTADSGSPIRVSDLKGKVALIDFWASWCVPCRASFPAIDTLQKELGGKGFRAIAVNLDEQRRNADQFLAARPHTMTIAFDPEGKAAEAFKLKGMPSTIVIDRHGNIRFTHMGYTEKTLAQFRAEILQLLGES